MELKEEAEKIQREMGIIEKKNKFAQLPLYTKLQMQKVNLGKKEPELRQMARDIETKRCQANFKSPKREHFAELESQWKNQGQVEVGKYKPKHHLIEPNQEKTRIYRKEQAN